MHKKTPTAIDLFCGAGGLTLGLKKAGFNVVAGVEINNLAAETYKINHPEVIVTSEDIRKIDPIQLILSAGLNPGELDLLAGGPPCQGFSTQRTRNKNTSEYDPRNDLIFEFIRCVKSIQPKSIMLENVPGLARDWRINKVKAELEILGYYINNQSISIHDAADYGAPQRRKRMLLKASRLGFIEEPQKVSTRLTVRQALSFLKKAGTSGDPLHDIQENRSEKIKELIKLIPKNGGSRKDLPVQYWLECHKRQPNSYLDVYGRMRWDDVSPTITGGCHNPSKGRFLHPEEDRAITLREAAILQTFPVDYYFSLNEGKDKTALMIGNALPPKFIEAHALKFQKHIKENT